MAQKTPVTLGLDPRVHVETVKPIGRIKLWRLKYRFAENEKLLAFGKYPIIGIPDAHRIRDEAKKLLAEGMDPAAQKRLDRLEAYAAP